MGDYVLQIYASKEVLDQLEIELDALLVWGEADTTIFDILSEIDGFTVEPIEYAKEETEVQ